MSHFPDVSTSVHQENAEFLEQPPLLHHKPPKHHAEQLQQRRSISGNIVGPSLSSFSSLYDAPLVHSLRPQEMRTTVSDWIKAQNHSDRYSSVLRSSSGSPLQLKTIESAATATSPLPDTDTHVSEQGIIEDYEDYVDDSQAGDDNDDVDDNDNDNDLYVDSSADLVPSEDSLDLEAALPLPLTNPHVHFSTDQLTINHGDQDVEDVDDEDQQSVDQRESVLNPYEAYFEVEPLNYGSPLAPEGTVLDLSKLDRSISAFPFVHEPEISTDELKVLALLDYELKQVGSSGLDVGALFSSPDEEDKEVDDEDGDGDEGKKKTFISWLFNRQSPVQRHAKKNPWYRILQLIDNSLSSDSDSASPPASSNGNHHSVNRDMVPIGYSGRLNLGSDDGQTVKFVPYT